MGHEDFDFDGSFLQHKICAVVAAKTLKNFTKILKSTQYLNMS